MTAREYLERKIKDTEKDLCMAEYSFNKCVEMDCRNYDAIISFAMDIKSFQAELKGMKVALDAMAECEG